MHISSFHRNGPGHLHLTACMHPLPSTLFTLDVFGSLSTNHPPKTTPSLAPLNTHQVIPLAQAGSAAYLLAVPLWQSVPAVPREEGARDRFLREGEAMIPRAVVFNRTVGLCLLFAFCSSAAFNDIDCFVRSLSRPQVLVG